jgi:polar amino acid transport system permease protein
MGDWLKLFADALPQFWVGAQYTLLLTAAGLVIGFVLGLLTAVARVYAPAPLRALAIGYVELFRGTPLLVQLFLIYYGLPSLGITFDRLTAAILALSLNSGAYQAEYIRGSLLAIGQGQMMAARAIGMSRWAAIVNIILPQALRLVIPSWANEPISLLKSNAIVFLIAVPELMTKAKSVAAKTYDPIGAYLAVAIVYLVLVFAVDYVLKRLERLARIPGFELEGKKA